MVYIQFRLQTLNRKIAYCCIRRSSLVLLASSAVYALNRITYLAVRGIHIFSSSKIKPEHRVLLYTLMFARAFGIFCFMLDCVPHTRQFVVYISFRLQKLNRKIAYCCIRRCSLVLLASSAVCALNRTTYLAVRGMHIISSSKIKPENSVLLYTFAQRNIVREHYVSDSTTYLNRETQTTLMNYNDQAGQFIGFWIVGLRNTRNATEPLPDANFET